VSNRYGDSVYDQISVFIRHRIHTRVRARLGNRPHTHAASRSWASVWENVDRVYMRVHRRADEILDE